MSNYCIVFFFNDTATTEIYTLSLHDALPIWLRRGAALQRQRRLLQLGPRRSDVPVLEGDARAAAFAQGPGPADPGMAADRKSTRLNSSHANISYAVFCLKKKTITLQIPTLYT